MCESALTVSGFTCPLNYMQHVFGELTERLRAHSAKLCRQNVHRGLKCMPVDNGVTECDLENCSNVRFKC